MKGIAGAVAILVQGALSGFGIDIAQESVQQGIEGLLAFGGLALMIWELIQSKKKN